MHGNEKGGQERHVLRKSNAYGIQILRSKPDPIPCLLPAGAQTLMFGDDRAKLVEVAPTVDHNLSIFARV